MRDLILKKNQLCRSSLFLRSAKFQSDLSREEVTRLIDEQNKIYDRYKFYDNYIKIGGKINARKKIYFEER